MRLVIALCLFTGVARAACTSVDQTHAQWSAILGRWVTDGGVDYAGLQREGQPALAAYLAALSGACGPDYERWTRAERIAFWINAYNAFTLRLILDHYPITSIRRIGWLPGAAFREQFIPMEGLKGGTISLDEIENGTLRGAFREPRIHFALVCASRSCPPLRSEAYRGADLDRQLDDQARAFLHDPTKNRVDPAARTLHLSSIFKWFRGDFEAAAGSLPAYVARYVDADTTRVADYDVEFLDYDWSLNDRHDGPTEDHCDAQRTARSRRRWVVGLFDSNMSTIHLSVGACLRACPRSALRGQPGTAAPTGCNPEWVSVAQNEPSPAVGCWPRHHPALTSRPADA